MLKKNHLRVGLDWFYKFLFVIQSICMYASVLTVVVTVFLREVFRISLVWGYEIACWFVIILVFTAMPANLHNKSNIGVTFVYDIVPKPVKKVFRVIHYLVEFACLIMMASGYKIWITKVGRGTMVASGFKNTLYYGIIGVGVAISILEMVCEIVDLFTKKEVVDEEAKELSIEEELAQEKLTGPEPTEEKTKQKEEAAQ